MNRLISMVIRRLFMHGINRSARGKPGPQNETARQARRAMRMLARFRRF